MILTEEMSAAVFCIFTANVIEGLFGHFEKISFKFSSILKNVISIQTCESLIAPVY